MSKDSIKVRKVGKYILQKELGKGSVGKVWLSFHSGLGIPVAVKTLKPHLIEEDPEFLERFIQEGRLAVTLHHKNIVRIFDAGKAGEIYYLVMEFLEGMDTYQILAQEGCFPLERVLEIACAVADALVEAHSHGVIHRDIKPDNIIITNEGKVKLADLGLAKKLDDEFSSTMIGSAIGTPNYMSPEQALNSREADPRSDIYSLGATLYHLATGTLPYEAGSCMAVMMKHTQEELENPKLRNSELPDDFCNIIMKMMEKDPSKRYQNCEELLTALNRFRYAPTSDEKPKTVVIKSKKFKKPVKQIEGLKAEQERKKKEKKNSSKKLTPILIAVLTAVILIPVLLFLLKGNQTQKDPETQVSLNSKTQDKVNKPADKAVKKTVLPEAVKPAPAPESINLLDQYKIKVSQKGFASFENGILKIKPRNKYTAFSTPEVYSNFKLIIEYQLKRKNCTGKIAIFSSEEKAYNIMIDNSENSVYKSGGIQIRDGTSPHWKFSNVHIPEQEYSKKPGKWNRMEIYCNGTNIKVIVNSHEVTNFDADVSEGFIALMVSGKTNISVRKLELSKLE